MQKVNTSREFIKAVFLLGIIQLIRLAIVNCSLITGSSNIRRAVVEICIISLLVVILLYMAKRESVTFSFFLISNNVFIVMVYSILSVIIIFTVMTMPAFTCGFDIRIFIPFLYVVVFVPVFEELLFRGYLWNKFEKGMSENYKLILLIICLSVFWFITSAGKLDTLSGSILAVTGTKRFIISRMAIGAGYGGILGFVRLVSKNTFACILCHSVMNMCLILI